MQNVLETKIWQCCITITNKLIRLTSHDTKHLDPASTNKHHLTFSFEKWARFPLGSNRCALAAGTSALGSGWYKHTHYTAQTYIQYKNTRTHTRTWYLMVQTHTIQNIKHTNTCTYNCTYFSGDTSLPCLLAPVQCTWYCREHMYLHSLWYRIHAHNTHHTQTLRMTYHTNTCLYDYYTLPPSATISKWKLTVHQLIHHCSQVLGGGQAGSWGQNSVCSIVVD